MAHKIVRRKGDCVNPSFPHKFNMTMSFDDAGVSIFIECPEQSSEMSRLLGLYGEMAAHSIFSGEFVTVLEDEMNGVFNVDDSGYKVRTFAEAWISEASARGLDWDAWFVDSTSHDPINDLRLWAEDGFTDTADVWDPVVMLAAVDACDACDWVAMRRLIGRCIDICMTSKMLPA